MTSNETTRNIQRLIWLYFWLLIFEGALRKWVVPQLATPLLIIRDPVVIWAYFLAIKKGIFANDIFTKIIICITFISLLGGLIQFITSNGNLTILAVFIFGFRTNFLHLPLIFLIYKAFSLDDVKKLGWWVLILAAPMAILMVFQFSSSPDAFINRIAGTGEGYQIRSAMGKIRPSATFSFFTGAAQYFSLVTSFLLYGLFQHKFYPNWLLFTSGLSLVLALAVSGSRTAIASVVIVLVSLIVASLVRPKLLSKSYKFLVLLGVVSFGASYLPFFNQGIEVLSARVEEGGSSEARSNGFADQFLSGTVGRFFGWFLEPFSYSDQIPLLGHGLGMGTNAGAALLTGKSQFLLAETEWARVVFESGFFLGLLYILLRIGIVFWLGRLCIKSLTAGNILPLLLLGACAVSISNGQFTQPTLLGFSVFGGGLCLASCKVKSHNQVLSASR